PGLTTRRVRLDHQGVQTFRSGVHSRGQTRGPGTDHHAVTNLGLVDVVVEAEATGDLLIRGIPKHALAPADQHGDLGHGDLEVIQHRLDVDVAFEIDIGVWVAIAGQELLDTKRAGG